MDMKKVKISIECGIVPPDDGKINVWLWEEHHYNTEWEANKPVWEIFNAHETFLLCVVGETIEVTKKKLASNFTKLE